MPDTYVKLYRWDLCSLCSGDGLANMVGDNEEGECPKCTGLGYVKSLSYYQLNVTELKSELGL